MVIDVGELAIIIGPVVGVILICLLFLCIRQCRHQKVQKHQSEVAKEAAEKELSDGLEIDAEALK
jgi:hypothetical protein